MTMAAARLNEKRWGISVHRRPFQLHAHALAVVHATADDFAAQVRELCAREVTGNQWDRFLTAYSGADPAVVATGRGATLAANKRDRLAALYRSDSRVAPWAGTAWGVVQAVNTFVQHDQTVRGSSRADRNALRAVTGGVDSLDRSTLETLARV